MIPITENETSLHYGNENGKNDVFNWHENNITEQKFYILH